MNTELDDKLQVIFADMKYQWTSDSEFTVHGPVSHIKIEALACVATFEVESVAEGLRFTVDPTNDPQKLIFFLREGYANVCLEGTGTVLIPKIAELFIVDPQLFDLMYKAVEFAKFKKRKPCYCAACLAKAKPKFDA